MNRSIHPEAEQDVADAFAYYEKLASTELAERFLKELERVAVLLIDNPGFGTPKTKSKRMFPLKGFPYSVVYQATDTDFRILVVRHQNRRSSFASHRH